MDTKFLEVRCIEELENGKHCTHFMGDLPADGERSMGNFFCKRCKINWNVERYGRTLVYRKIDKDFEKKYVEPELKILEPKIG
jgi:hypothetical protein